VEHWQHLSELAAGDDGSSEHVFLAELREAWWRHQQRKPGSSQDAAAVVGGHDQGDPDGRPAAPGNMRDRVFALALPTDWQEEAQQPAGLSCSLFRYQRHCLAWLTWRESLGGQATSVSSVPSGQHAARVGEDIASAMGSQPCPDVRSAKAQLASRDLRWQHVTLPSGLEVCWDPVGACVRREVATPPLPEVPGGILADEMGLGGCWGLTVLLPAAHGCQVYNAHGCQIYSLQNWRLQASSAADV
jgi:hypothetical protein